MLKGTPFKCGAASSTVPSPPTMIARSISGDKTHSQSFSCVSTYATSFPARWKIRRSSLSFASPPRKAFRLWIRAIFTLSGPRSLTVPMTIESQRIPGRLGCDFLEFSKQSKGDTHYEHQTSHLYLEKDCICD